MSQKTLKVRIQQKADTWSNWAKVPNKTFKPLENELIIYLPDDTNALYKCKLGDGDNYIEDLDFVDLMPITWKEF